MCVYLRSDSSDKELRDRFQLPFPDHDVYQPTSIVYAGDFPIVPVVRKSAVELFNWGLIPSTTKNSAQSRYFRINNQNARIESVTTTRSFKEITANRCLITLNGFYTKNKKILFKSPNRNIISVAGLWDSWVNQENGAVVNSFTILTTEASAQMRLLNGEAKRMPVVLAPWEEAEWLRGAEIDTFADRSQIEIIAIKWEETI